MKKRQKCKKTQINMYDVVPHSLVKHDNSQDGNVILLKPKFRNPFLTKYIIPRLKKPFFKITLDDVGSFIWSKIDGSRNAVEISEELEKEFGEKIQPANERLGLFLAMLKKAELIDY